MTRDEFVAVLNAKGVACRLSDNPQTGPAQPDQLIYFTDLSLPGLFLLGKVFSDRFVLHERYGMEGQEYTFQELNDAGVIIVTDRVQKMIAHKKQLISLGVL